MFWMTPPRAPRNSERHAAHSRAIEHARRCSSLPPLRKGEAEQLVQNFLAEHSVTLCPSQQLPDGTNNLGCGWGGGRLV